MSAVLLRRRRLGKGSCNGIANVSTAGIKVVRNWADVVPVGVDYVFRWGCTSMVDAYSDIPVFVNMAKAIHWCSDKRESRLDMQEAGVPVPRTWGSYADWRDAIPTDVLAGNGSVVIRPVTHAQGRNLFVVNNEEVIREYRVQELERQFGQIYISQLVNKVAEYRVMVVQNRVAWVAKKTPGNPEDVAWNVAQGGRFDNVKWGEWPVKVVQAALLAAWVGELDFGGVDVMVDAEGNPYVLEVNSAPSQTSPYRQQCLAKCFDYIVANGKRHFPEDPRGATSWKQLIHPAVQS